MCFIHSNGWYHRTNSRIPRLTRSTVYTYSICLSRWLKTQLLPAIKSSIINHHIYKLIFTGNHYKHYCFAVNGDRKCSETAQYGKNQFGSRSRQSPRKIPPIDDIRSSGLSRAWLLSDVVKWILHMTSKIWRSKNTINGLSQIHIFETTDY